MAEEMWVILKILLVLVVAVLVIGMIYLLKDVMYEKTDAIKDIFLNLFKFS